MEREAFENLPAVTRRAERPAASAELPSACRCPEPRRLAKNDRLAEGASPPSARRVLLSDMMDS
jgi:hypothetical protein